MVDFASMRPRRWHNDGAMASGGVRVQRTARREGKQRAACGALGGESKARDPDLREEAALDVSGNGLFRPRRC